MNAPRGHPVLLSLRDTKGVPPMGILMAGTAFVSEARGQKDAPLQRGREK